MADDYSPVNDAYRHVGRAWATCKRLNARSGKDDVGSFCYQAMIFQYFQTQYSGLETSVLVAFWFPSSAFFAR